LALVPFVSFIVLAGNAIATSSSTDLELLSSILQVLAPAAAESSSSRNVYDACERFGRIANAVVADAGENQYQAQNPNTSVPLSCPSAGGNALEDTQSMPPEYGLPMAQQDWDSVMMDFQSEMGEYDSRTLTSILEPYLVNSGWQFDGPL
jgi:hypothetical protein